MHKDLPKNFDYKTYISLNPDLSLNGINDEISATSHYLLFGAKEQRAYSLQKLIDTSTDIDFDPIFYLSEYPDVASYYKNTKHIPEKEKLLHHYVNFGKQEGRYKNKQQKNIRNNKKLNISQIIPFSSLKHYINKLECLVLLVTNHEIKNGQFLDFINRLINNTNKKEAKNISFKIILNNNNTDMQVDCTLLKSVFNSVEIINLSLSKEDDIYVKDSCQLEKIPIYGNKSGPNIMFYQALDICKTYNTILLLETDCFFKPSWLQKLKDFINHSNGFWISGAIYDGAVPTKACSDISTHINGGVGLYATGNPLFRLFIATTEMFLLERINNGLVGLAYDMAIKMYIDHIINCNHNTNEEVLLGKFINRQYLPNKIIGNFSTPKDIFISLEQISNIYNYYIIHKKS